MTANEFNARWQKHKFSLTFNGFTYPNCSINADTYSSGGSIALEILDYETGELVAIATCNISREPLHSNCVFIKNYSENTGLQQALAGLGIIRPTGRFVQTGYVSCEECELVID